MNTEAALMSDPPAILGVMTFCITDPETERLARELAGRMGVSVTAALTAALTDCLGRTDRERDVAYGDVIAVGLRGRSRPMLDQRSSEQIAGYGDHGLPV
ncbi:type II toxin-antitoxin system VapB family antitoxin [Ruania suaedae]|uniref:type II toxin-antitoxin system VapB family antitoxin n=1 Tax=Ruania suaedae TaxID=2897774 RepID=UPI001E54C057|nr:type II toxin-antitoxin system VapB family antitoxin [Ruania suaedae]UFU03796.1 type II toxin-antitoxin system VapB family antitoxin [Ruania suaedae]